MDFYSTTEIRLTANTDYVWGRPYLDGATVHYYADVQKALFDFESEVLDTLPLPLTETKGRQHERSDVISIQTDAAALVCLRLTPQIHKQSLWHNVIKYAIDVDTLLQLQYRAKFSKTASIAFPLPYNHMKARRRLKHADRNYLQPLSLIYARLLDNTGRAIATRLVHDYLSQIGLQIEIKTVLDAFQ